MTLIVENIISVQKMKYWTHSQIKTKVTFRESGHFYAISESEFSLFSNSRVPVNYVAWDEFSMKISILRKRCKGVVQMTFKCWGACKVVKAISNISSSKYLKISNIYTNTMIS